MNATLIRDIEHARIKPDLLLDLIDHPRELSWRDPIDRAAIVEAEFAAKTLGMPLGKMFKEIGAHFPIGGAGGLTQGYSELYYVSIATGTQLNTFTTEASLMGALKHCIIPAGYLNQAERSLRIRAIGRLGTTGTPTFTFSVRFINSTTFSAGGGLGVSSAAITGGSGVTLAPWSLDMDILVRSVGAGGGSNTTLAFFGEVAGQTAFASPFQYYMPAANTAFTGSLDSSATQYLYVSVACGTSNASNLCQLEMLKIHAEN